MLGWEFPPFRSGGLGTHCYHLTNGLSALGVDITFLMPKSPFSITSDYMKIVQIDSRLFGPYRTGQMLNRNYGLNLFDDIWSYNQMCVDYAMGMKESFDIIHCHDWLTSIAAVELRARTGKPLVATIHSTEYDRTGSLSPNSWIVEREMVLVRNADVIITVSEMMRKQLIERYGADPGKIAVIYNAVDHGSWAGPEVNAAFPGQKVILFMGRLTIQKGPDFFLKAAKKALSKNPNLRFVLGGTGDMMPQLIREAIHLGISDKVMFLGYVPDSELARLYAAADVFVLPSVSEPFGITVLEAIASGTPAIISRQSGVREVVKNSFSVDFWDVDGMASKMLALTAYPKLHKSMRENSRKEISSYTWRSVAQETVGKAYNKAIGIQ